LGPITSPGKTKKKLHGYDLQSANTSSPMAGADISVSDSGWTKEGIGKLWFSDTFLKSIGPARPQLLIFDGHSSHNNIEFIELARKENIILVELPSHTSNWTQPLADGRSYPCSFFLVFPGITKWGGMVAPLAFTQAMTVTVSLEPEALP
jgi:hypothetical protein